MRRIRGPPCFKKTPERGQLPQCATRQAGQCAQFHPRSPVGLFFSPLHEHVHMCTRTWLTTPCGGRCCRLMGLSQVPPCSIRHTQDPSPRPSRQAHTALSQRGLPPPGCAARSRACFDPPWVLAACRLSVWGPKKKPFGSQNWRRERMSGHVRIERKHSNSGRGSGLLLID
jgi:hypothetical protein